MGQVDTEMQTFLKKVLTDAGATDAVKCCQADPEKMEAVVLTSAAFGGGGEQGDDLLAEMALFGSFAKLAASYGKRVIILPQE